MDVQEIVICVRIPSGRLLRLAYSSNKIGGKLYGFNSGDNKIIRI